MLSIWIHLLHCYKLHTSTYTFIAHVESHISIIRSIVKVYGLPYMHTPIYRFEILNDIVVCDSPSITYFNFEYVRTFHPFTHSFTRSFSRMLGWFHVHCMHLTIARHIVCIINLYALHNISVTYYHIVYLQLWWKYKRPFKFILNIKRMVYLMPYILLLLKLWNILMKIIYWKCRTSDITEKNYKKKKLQTNYFSNTSLQRQIGTQKLELSASFHFFLTTGYTGFTGISFILYWFVQYE